ncbi:MAG: substrate-binding domain-containing protein [Planctomycetota bacterium]|nr:substrate-binding domain-containing protein [Planctomycetota bacterium]
MNRRSCLVLGLAAAIPTVGCRSSAGSPSQTLRVATTTSTRDSGLIDQLIPVFETESGLRVKLIAVGSGKALELGRRGDVDVILVHSEKDEDRFMENGHGVRRDAVMFNFFEILGPTSDPAVIRDCTAVEAMKKIKTGKSPFVSRGDNSGTHRRELELWNQANLETGWEGYLETGQGMGPTLTIASQKQAYCLCDRGTYLARKQGLGLVPLARRSPALKNPYSAICIAPHGNHRIREKEADRFVEFLISSRAQELIESFRIDGEPLFHPLRLVKQ